MQKNEVQHIERADRANTRQQRAFAVAVEHLQREPAAINLTALTHEFGELIAKVLRAGEWLVAQFRKTTLYAERDTRPIQQHRGLKSFSLQTQRLKNIDETDGAFEGDGVKRDERFFSGLRFNVLKDLFFVIDQIVTFLMRSCGDGGHGLTPCWRCLVPASEPRTAISKARAIYADAHPFIKSSQVRRFILSIFASEIGEYLFPDWR